jgi:MFS family permease
VSEPTGPGARRSALAAGFTVLFVATGVNLSFGILFKPILLTLGGDRSTLALAAAAGLLVNAFGQPAFGALIDRFGPRRVILPSMALMAAGTALVSLAARPWQFIALYGIVAAVGYTGTGLLPVSVHVSRWFPAERGFVTALAACGFSLGQLVFSQLAARLVTDLGWRATYRVLALILGASLALFVWWLRDAPRPSTGAPTPPGDVDAGRGASWAAGRPLAPADPRARSLDRRAALGTRAFWGLTGGLVGCGFTDFVINTHLPPFAADLGFPAAVAANALSLWAAANVLGILLAGSLATRIGARRALVITYALRAGSLFYLLAVRTPGQLYVFALLFGATFFTTAPLSSTLVATLFGPVHHGAIFGAANLFHHSAGALGSYAGGLAFDWTGGYRSIFLASAMIATGSALVTLVARKPGR